MNSRVFTVQVVGGLRRTSGSELKWVNLYVVASSGIFRGELKMLRPSYNVLCSMRDNLYWVHNFNDLGWCLLV